MDPIRELFDLTGKVAVITGGAGLLGKEYGDVLASAGANVVLVDLDQARCEAVARSLQERYGTPCLGIPADISSKDAVNRMGDLVIRNFGRVDVLINNAFTKSANYYAPFESYSLQDWEKVFSVNITGMFLCAQRLVPEMVKQGGGSIINVASIFGVVAPDQRIYEGAANIYASQGAAGNFSLPVSYAASKSAVLNFTRYLASYYRCQNVRVNTFTPGGVYDRHDPKFVENYSSRTLLGRMARKEEYRGAILFLASNASSYMTGANIVADGGWTAW